MLMLMYGLIMGLVMGIFIGMAVFEEGTRWAMKRERRKRRELAHEENVERHRLMEQRRREAGRVDASII